MKSEDKHLRDELGEESVLFLKTDVANAEEVEVNIATVKEKFGKSNCRCELRRDCDTGESIIEKRTDDT